MVSEVYKRLGLKIDNNVTEPTDQIILVLAALVAGLVSEASGSDDNPLTKALIKDVNTWSKSRGLWP